MSEERMIEVSSEREQAGPSTVANPVSTVIRRSTRVSASKKVNQAMVNSVTDQQQGTLVNISFLRWKNFILI